MAQTQLFTGFLGDNSQPICTGVVVVHITLRTMYSTVSSDALCLLDSFARSGERTFDYEVAEWSR